MNEKTNVAGNVTQSNDDNSGRVETVEEWSHNGLRCKVKKMDIGHYCGYVRSSFTGPWTYEDFQGYPAGLIDIHGGLTHGPDSDGWIGFDCGHSRDVCLNDNDEPFGRSYEELNHEPLELSRRGSIEACEQADDCFVWRAEDVKEETERLADQVVAVQTFAERVLDWGL